jgi:SAM-dependent methyltransferase
MIDAALAARADTSDLPIPEDDLRWRVTGYKPTPDDFVRLGRQSAEDLQKVLSFAEVRLAEAARVLDFGTGCGRVLRHLRSIADRVELHGCDIDRDAIDWSSAHLTFAKFECNGGLPPLPYDDDYFDVVINHSVFTHLPEEYQDSWLAELSRVVSPGGHLALSVAGMHAFQGLVQSYLDWPADPSDIQRVMREDGFLYIADDVWTGTTFPDFYHSAFHSPDYVIRHWAKYFSVLGYFPRAALGFQDIVLLRNDILKTRSDVQDPPQVVA